LGVDRTLVLNTGDNIGRLKKDEDFEKRKARLLYNLTGQVGVEVLTPGATDFAFGVEFLKNVDSTCSFSMVCGNLVRKEDGLPVFTPYNLFQKGDLKILVSSVLDSKTKFAEDSLRADSPIETLKHVKKSVPHDIFIVVLFLDEIDAQKVIQEVGDIHFAILGNKRNVGYLPNLNSDELVTHNSSKGRNVAYVDVFRKDQGDVAFTTPIARLAGVGDVKENRSIKKYIQRFNFGETEKKYPDRIQRDDHYLGANWCVRCHQEEYAIWEKTDHAHAFETLVKEKASDNPVCLECHETKRGITLINESKTAFSMPLTSLQGVQCEACHGPGAKHVQDPEDNLMKDATAQTCIVCHNEERDADFAFSKDINKIKH
jgi:cytochrome c554/c'-like protein